MTACLQILVQGEWRWSQHWKNGRHWPHAHKWASEVTGGRQWRLLLRGVLGLCTWTCSEGDSRIAGMWSPPVFRAWLTRDARFVPTVESMLQLIREKDGAPASSFILRGSEENYIVLLVGDEVEVAARPKGTKMNPELIYGGTKKAFSEDPLAAFSSHKPERIWVGETS